MPLMVLTPSSILSVDLGLSDLAPARRRICSVVTVMVGMSTSESGRRRGA